MEIGKIDRRKLFEIVFLAAVLAFSFNQIYRVHYGYTGLIQDPHSNPNYLNVTDFSYPYPIHADEWTHLAQAVYIMDTGTPGFVNPYSPQLYHHTDMEFGYHLFLALFFGASGLDPVLGYQYLPALFFVINAAFLFLLVKRLTKNYCIALLSVPFFLAVPSNTNIMGNWFAIPLTFSLFMVYAFFLLFDGFLENGNRAHLIWSAAVYCLSAVTYPPTAILISIIVMVQFLLRVKAPMKGFLKRNLLPVSGSGLMALALMLALVVFPDFSVLSLGWTSFQYDYSPILFYGLLPTVLAAAGVFAAIKKNMGTMFIIWPAVFILNLISYRIAGAGLFFAYERSIYYLLVGLAPLAAIGLFHILKVVRDITGRLLPSRYKNFIPLVLVLVLALTVFGTIFLNYYNISERDLVLLHLLGEQDYEAIKFIGDNYGSGNVVLADSLISLGLYPISRNHAVAVMPSNLGHGDIAIFSVFAASDCVERLEIIDDENIDFVLSMVPLDCGFLAEVYDRGDYVYRVRK